MPEPKTRKRNVAEEVLKPIQQRRAHTAWILFAVTLIVALIVLGVSLAGGRIARNEIEILTSEKTSLSDQLTKAVQEYNNIKERFQGTDASPLRAVAHNTSKTVASDAAFYTALHNPHAPSRSPATACTRFDDLVDDDRIFYGVDVLEHARVVAFFEKTVSLEWHTNLVDVLKQHDANGLLELCAFGSRMYLTTNNAPDIDIYYWNTTTNAPQLFMIRISSTGSLSDGEFSMQFDRIKDRVLAHTRSNNDSDLFWSYYLLDENTQTADLLERCGTTSAGTGDEKQMQQTSIELTCEREYTPN